MPICSECGKSWRPTGRRFENGKGIVCTECYVRERLKRNGLNGF
ncbi:MAG: hypothetical protein ACLFTQ_01350 [Candidatus Aenigmatarchaeota archaeon]